MLRTIGAIGERFKRINVNFVDDRVIIHYGQGEFYAKRK
jgi:hypothetical protein